MNKENVRILKSIIREIIEEGYVSTNRRPGDFEKYGLPITIYNCKYKFEADQAIFAANKIFETKKEWADAITKAIATTDAHERKKKEWRDKGLSTIPSPHIGTGFDISSGDFKGKDFVFYVLPHYIHCSEGDDIFEVFREALAVTKVPYKPRRTKRTPPDADMSLKYVTFEELVNLKHDDIK